MTITAEREQDQETVDRETRERRARDQQSSERRTAQIEHSLELARACARAADETRAADIRVLDLTEVTPIVDFFVIATGTSRRQMHAIAEEVDRAMKSRGSRRIGVEGFDAGTWILQDYGDIVLHVFTEETRELYDLERLWADATTIEWQPAGETNPESTAD